MYEYDLTDWWQHEIRLEQVLPLDPAMPYPMCTAGKRRGPLEGCGGPWAFMELQDNHPHKQEQLYQLHLCELAPLQIPPEVWLFSALQELHLCDNQLSSLPAELGQLSSLQAVYLDRNPFLGSRDWQGPTIL